ncbi:MAG: PEP-CTERM sorting domain-containing protein [Planctomycetes bacterium]|nr:PEP-CTERM sorting domain-containing protein [Planctomycetota bacterium]
MKKTALFLIIYCLTMPLQAADFYYTDYEYDGPSYWKTVAGDYPSFKTTEYSGTIMRVGVVGENTIDSAIGARAIGSTVNQICSAVVMRNAHGAGPAVSLNLDEFRMGMNRRNHGMMTLEDCQTAIVANVMMMGSCEAETFSTRLSYGKLEAKDGGTLAITIAGDVGIGRVEGDNYNEGIGSELIVRDGATLNMSVGGDMWLGAQHGPDGGGNCDTGCNANMNLSASGSASLSVSGDMYIGTGRGAAGVLTFNSSADCEFTVGGALTVGGMGSGVRADGEGHLTVAGKAGLDVTENNVSVGSLIVGGNGEAFCTVTLEAGTHMALTGTGISVGNDDIITLDYDGSSSSQTWLRMADSQHAVLAGMIGSRIVAGGSAPTGAFGVYDDGGYSYVCYGITASQPYDAGDCDKDYDVDAVDLAVLGLNWAPSGTTKIWADGDFDEDGDIDAVDLAALGLNWAPSGYAVPEPTTMALLAAGGMALIRRRRR